MNTMIFDSDAASRIKRLPVAIAAAAASLGLIAIVFATTREHSPGAPADRNNAPVEKQQSTLGPTWNVALGNVVVLAPELGLRIDTPNLAEVDPEPIAAMIESQMLGLRRLYREESQKNPGLVGGFDLQIEVGPAGSVAEVKKISTRIQDDDFRKAVIDEVSKWNFQDLVPQGTIIDCPLLFVLQGMDITTLVNWEKAGSGQRAAQKK
ncbi:MAG: AgmX/PglI C-terminal domain-containing protein [Deltaproteobacteria bacterium]|nr:AgmX/PglI C-terminal domain-containing protein [Deltaproteobacteria bacterium]